MKNKRGLIIVVSLVILVIFGSVVGVKCGFTGNPKAEDRPAVTAPEIVDELIKRESGGHASTTPSPAPPPTKAPVLSDKAIYIGDTVNFSQANFVGKVTLVTSYGEEWTAWMRSEVSFRKLTHAFDPKVGAGVIWLSVYIQPQEKWDDKNNITLTFDLHAPKGEVGKWSATIRMFSSATQGEAWFPPAYKVYRENWQEEEVLHLAKQVLAIALKTNID